MGRKARHYGTEAEGLEPPRACARRISSAWNQQPQGKGGADRARKDGLRVGPCPRSVPVALGVPLEGTGEFGIALASPDGALDEIDAAAEVGESGGSRDTVDGG